MVEYFLGGILECNNKKALTFLNSTAFAGVVAYG
jgi:hypothetical protein